MNPRWSIPCALAFSLALARVSLADKSAAVLLFDEAERLVAANRMREACPKFGESYRLDPQIGVLLHLADCQEQIGQIASAWANFREAADLAEKLGDPRVADARGYATALEPRLTRLTVTVSEAARVPGLEVRRDGQTIGEPLWGSSVPVDPGEHLVEASAPGMKPWSSRVRVAKEGQQVALEVPVLRAAPAPERTESRAPDPTPDTRQPSDRGSIQRLVGWTVAGAGVLGLGVGLVFQLKTSSTVSERDGICPTRTDCTVGQAARRETLTEDAKSSNMVALIGFAAGGVLVAGGLVTVFTAPSGNEVAVAPEVGPGFAGLTMSRKW